MEDKFIRNYENRLYRAWRNMRMRCSKSVKSNPQYKDRKIKVCEEWDDFNKFVEWSILNGYSDGLTIDRIDNYGNYEPNNCRWVPRNIQNINKSSNIWTAINGVNKTLSQHAEYYNIPHETIRKRYHRGIRGNHLIYKGKISSRILESIPK